MSGGLLTNRAPQDGWLSRQATNLGLYLLPLLGLLVLWWVVSGLRLIPRQALPTPANVADALVTLVTDGALASTISTTIMRVVLAFVIAIVVGFVIGMAMSQSTPRARSAS